MMAASPIEAAGEISELPGRSIKAGQILQQTWWAPGFARSGLPH
jgi:hypothetical protein